MKWRFLAGLLLGSVAIYWSCVRLMRVVMTERELRISNYRREIVVALSDVDEVTVNRWVKLHPVTIQFVRRTDFGHSIVFMPKARPFAGFASPRSSQSSGPLSKPRNEGLWPEPGR